MDCATYLPLKLRPTSLARGIAEHACKEEFVNDFLKYPQLNAARRRSIAGAFSSFLDEQIGIRSGTRERASGSQNALRDYLRGLADDDRAFPRILRLADSDFLGGSFARHTKIWPLNDIDVYLPIDATGLVYMLGGVPAPCTALHDEILDENPLSADYDRWWDGSYLSSKKLIAGFASALRKNYQSTTRVRRGGAAVTVTLANDLGFDVVPCFSLKPHASNELSFYLIPDGNDGWIRTNPRLDQGMSDDLHRSNHKTLRPSVKLFKWWANEFIGDRIQSYYAELAIMRAFENQNRQGQVISTVSTGTLAAFRAVRDAIRAGDQRPILQSSPMVEPGDVTDRDISILNQDVENCKAAFVHEQGGRIDEALTLWGKIFGDKFPTG